MKRSAILLALMLVPLVSVAQAARVQMPDLSALADKAKESVDISLDKEMLKTAGAFMGRGNGMDPEEFAQLVKDLDGVYVKVFSFAKPGAYSMRDIEPMVKQVEGSGWKKLLSVRDGQERVEMWMRDNHVDGGMFFVASEPQELVLINILGKVDLESIRKLQGRMGVPNLQGWMGSPPPATPAPPAPPVKGATPAPAAPAAR